MTAPFKSLENLDPDKRRALAILLKRTKGIDLFADLPIKPVPHAAGAPLSYAQERLWFLSQLEPDSAAYNIVSALRLHGRLSLLALQRSLDDLVRRHESLRTTFSAPKGVAVQLVHEPRALSMNVVDRGDMCASSAAREAAAQELTRTEANTPFDLQTGPLLRVTLVKLAEADHLLLLTMHHIVSDGWSMNIVVRELGEIYQNYDRGIESPLPALPIQYADYAMWQRWRGDAGGFEESLRYWKEHLGGEQPTLDLSFGRPKTSASHGPGARRTLSIARPLSEELRRLAGRHEATLFMVLLTAFDVLLYRYTRQGDIRVGVPIANRNRIETERLIGSFVNTLVIRAEVHGCDRFDDLLRRVKTATIGAQAHQDLPFQRLVEALQPARDLDRNPLFQVMYNHLPHDETSLVELAGLRLEPQPLEVTTTQLDLSLDTREGSKGEILAILEYARDAFEEETIERLGTHWIRILEQAARDETTRVGEFDLLTVSEREDVAGWNAPKKHATRDMPVHARIAARAAEAPMAEAVSHDGGEATYSEIDRRSNQLARRLIGLGVVAEAVVAVAVERSIENVISMLAVWKAGGVYLPLDPAYPPGRLRFMAEDAAASVLITQESLRGRIGAELPALPRIYVDDAALYREADTSPGVLSHEANLAYVIYTSGSTGEPKGVAITHGALAMHGQAMGAIQEIRRGDRALHFASLSFDAAVEQWIVPLMHGASVVVGSQLWSAEQARAAIQEQRITHVDFPPAYAVELARSAERTRERLQVRVCTVGGEPLVRESLDSLRRGIACERIVNAYGPTEAVITPLSWEVHKESICETPYAPIGRAVGERTAYVLDGDMNIVPRGVVGELCIGGLGIARGYHRRAALTAERFVPDPFNRTGGRLYRTGDLARYRSDGTVEYVGRVDEQVKIRGYRVELGEVEAQLHRDGRVEEATVVVREERGSKRLVAYVAGKALPAMERFAEELRARVALQLPEYMVPSQIVALAKLPRTANGKVDRKALPASLLPLRGYVAPRTAAERDLAGLWQSVLGIERVGVTDHFFEIGGDSIVSIQIVSRARQLGWQIAPKDLFAHPTLEALARVARKVAPWSVHEIEDASPAQGEVGFLPIQAAFFEQPIPERHWWNQSLLLRMKGAVDIERLGRALDALLEHHDALRLRYVEREGRWTQWYALAGEALGQDALWVRRPVGKDDVERVAEEAQRSLDLERGPLFRAVAMMLEDGAARLLLLAHHLVVDGVSWRILLDDLHAAYRQAGERLAIQLPPRTSSYRTWARELAKLAASDELAAQLPYWEKLAAVAVIELPCDFATRDLRQCDAETVVLRLDVRRTSQLLQEAPAAYRTQINELLLTALARALAQWTGHASAYVELEGHGREDLVENVDLARSVGWFTTTFPVLLPVATDLSAAVLSVKESLRQVPVRGIGFGLLRYLAPEALRARAAALPRPRVTFNYLGQFDATFDENALFEPAAEVAGHDRSPHGPLDNWLEINGQIYDGALTLGWTFSRAMFRRETIERLADRCRAEIEALVDHCCRDDAGGVSPADFPLAELSIDELRALPFPPRTIEDVYPLTPLQQGMLFHTMFAPDEPAYVTQIDVVVEGLDPDRFLGAFRQAVGENAVLRSAFVWNGVRKPTQVVLKEVPLDVALLDWADGPLQPTQLQDLCLAERARLFQLDVPPLQRLVLVRLGHDRHHLVWTSHHLLLDGWSGSLLWAEILRNYARTVSPTNAGKESSLAGASSDASHPLAHYRDYVAWLKGRDQVATEAFWRSRLAELDDGPTLLAASVKADSNENGHGIERVCFDAHATQVLRDFANRCDVTLNTLVQGAWSLLLARYTGRRTVSFGATVSGRPPNLEGSDRLIGLFINTLPVIATLAPESFVGDWLRELQTQNLALRDHEHAALYDVQRWAAGGEGRSLFDSIIVFENYPVADALVGDSIGLRFGQVRTAESTNYPMTLVVRAGEKLDIVFDHARTHFGEQMVRQMARHFQELMRHISEDSSQRIGELQTLTTIEVEQVARRNASGRRYQKDTPVHVCIARRAAQEPEADAVVCEDRRISYGELDRRANQLAHRLRRLGVGPDTLVAISAERSPEIVVGMLAIWKAGGAYVPLDPAYPDERLRFMLSDCGASILLTQEHLREKLDWTSEANCVLLDDREARAESDISPDVHVFPEHLAYVIYTSGSTGQPKGVAVAHGALAMHMQAAGTIYAMTARDRALHFASMSFDAAVEQWVVPLAHGARLILSGNEQWSPARVASVVESEAITVIYPPTSHLLGLADWAEEHDLSLRLRVCTVGGEAVSRDAYERIRRVLQPSKIINGYGPTETVVTPLLWEAGAETPCATAYAPIGRAVGERTTYVLDVDLNLVPVAVVGELYIGGAGVARGYHEQPGLTAERFVPDPFGGHGQRLYRTGDLVRHLADGNVEYVGRTDEQVKVRGYRVELGEVESQLLRDERVDEAAVVVREERGAKRLVAYVVAHDEHRIATLGPTLREALARRLPEHMVPSQVMVLAELPRTPNGKIDRKALPAAELPPREYVPPRTEVEQDLVAIWKTILGLDRIGITDNFFELGGDSIVSIQVVSRARQAGLRITPKDIFKNQTIEALGRVARRLETYASEAGPTRGDVPLLPIQKAFFERPIANRHWWNQALLLDTNDANDAASLTTAIGAVLDHHDALRLRFRECGGQLTQRYVEPREAPAGDAVWVRDIVDSAAIARLAEEAQRSLDLDKGPLLRAVVMRLGDGTSRLLLVIHHLVIDGVSWRILLEDLQTAYRQARQGQPAQLPGRTSPYQVWSRELRALVTSDAIAGELPYWEDVLASAAVEPRRDFAETHPRRCDADTVTLRLDRKRTEQLLRNAPAAYRTRIDDLLLTALARTLARWTGGSVVPVELEGHGREDLFDGIDLARTVGWFTTTYPVALRLSSDLGRCILAVKDELRRVPRRGIGFGLLKYLAPEPLRARVAALPSPRVTFNYLGQFDATFPADALFRPARESAGEDQSPDAPLGNWLEINGQIFDGALETSWTFARTMFRRDTIQSLVDSYRDELVALIEHCLGDDATGVSPSDFPLAALSIDDLRSLPFHPRLIEDVYPLTPLQQGMLFHALSSPDAPIYVTQLDVVIECLDAERLFAAWTAAIGRHSILRTAFVWQGLPHPVQVVLKDVPFSFDPIDGTHLTKAAIDELRRKEHGRGFALDTPPLQRVLLVRLGDNRHHLVWTSHHLLLDGWSSSLLLGEVLERYAKLGAACPKPSLDVAREESRSIARYSDYIAWLAGRDVAATEDFWRERLRRVDQPTLLAMAIGVRRAASGYGARATHLSEDETKKLKRFAEEQRVTLSTVVQGAWALLLRRYTQQAAVVYGLTVAGRPASVPGSDTLLGLFINTLPVAHSVAPEASVGACLRALQDAHLEMRQHEHAPLYDIQRWAGASGQPLFDTLLVFENYPIDRALRQKSGELRFGELNTVETTNYAMTVGVSAGETIDIGYDYDREHFDDEAVEQLREHFERLLRDLVEDAARPVGALTMGGPMPSSEGATPSVTSERGVSNLPVEHRISLQARARPLDVAIEHGAAKLRFGDLERRASRLARQLVKAGARAETVVAIGAARSVDMIVAMLGVWKAGAAFLPLDPAYPAERLRYMLADAGTSMVVTQASVRKVFDWPSELPVFLLDDAEASRDDDGAFAVPMHPEALAYVIYTSGSTGRPKGVAVSRAAIAAHCSAAAAVLRTTPEDRVLHFASISFDASIEQWAVPLMCGARVVISDDETWSVERAYQELSERRVTQIDLPPSYLFELARWLDENGKSLDVRTCTVGGEALSRAAYDRIRRSFGNANLVNAYGPTEGVITPLAWQPEAHAPCNTTYAPIGNPVGDRTALVLDADLNPLPTGVTGDLYLGGTGLARGYLAHPDLTAERFVPDPFGRPGSRMYRTGDRGQRLDDGAVAYIGRSDHQVKVRGFRVELAEVESYLLAQGRLKEAVVVAHEENLVGYVVPPSDEHPERLKRELFDGLHRRLPAHMIPSLLVVVAAIPRTSNGKIDRKALPRPERAALGRTPPRTSLERDVAGIWQELLGSEPIGVEDHFFEIGGHSLRALSLVSRVNNRFGAKLTLGRFLQRPTVAGVAAFLGGIALPPLSPLLPLNSSGAGEPPLFCLHAAGGTVFSYDEVAQELTGMRPVIGVLCRTFLDPRFRDRSLDQMARDYAELIDDAQPEGPCHLLGWSLGGALAIGVAAALEGCGRTVAFLGFVDGFVPGLDIQPGSRGALVEGERDDQPDAIDPRFGPAEVAAGRAAMAHLTALSKTYELPPVRVAPHCWWASDTSEDAELARRMLEHAIGQEPRASSIVPGTTHATILRSPTFLRALRVALQHRASSHTEASIDPHRPISP